MQFEITPVNKMQYLNLCFVHEWGAEFNAKSRIKKCKLPSAQDLLEDAE
jgi:hypothetical protein